MPGRPLKPESKNTSKDLQTLHANRYLLQTGQRRCWILLTLQTPRTSSPRESWNSKLSMLRYTACSDFPFGPCPMAPTHTWKTNGCSKVKRCQYTAYRDFQFGLCLMAPTNTWKTNGYSKVKRCNDTQPTETPFGPYPMAPAHTWKTNGCSKVKRCYDT